MFVCEGVVFDVRLARPENVLRLRVVTEPTRAISGVVNLTIAQVRSLFDGYSLARAHALVTHTTKIQRRIIFGTWGRGRTRAWLCYQLGRIGTAMPPSAGGCGKCEEVEGACTGCARRIVNETLAEEPLRFLYAASRHRDPLKQLEAVSMARATERKRLAMARKAKPMRTKNPIERDES